MCYLLEGESIRRKCGKMYGDTGDADGRTSMMESVCLPEIRFPVRTPKTADTQTELLKFQGKTLCIRIQIFKSRQLSAEHWQEVDQFYGDGALALL